MQAKCVECSYSLVGLPSRGRCPECGRVYDLTWEYEPLTSGEQVRALIESVRCYLPTARTVSIAAFILMIAGVVAGLAWYGLRQLNMVSGTCWLVGG